MALKRVWTPTGSYSSGSARRLIVTPTEGFNRRERSQRLRQPISYGDVGASSRVCMDNVRGNDLGMRLSRQRLVDGASYVPYPSRPSSPGTPRGARTTGSVTGTLSSTIWPTG